MSAKPGKRTLLKRPGSAPVPKASPANAWASGAPGQRTRLDASKAERVGSSKAEKKIERQMGALVAQSIRTKKKQSRKPKVKQRSDEKTMKNDHDRKGNVRNVVHQTTEDGTVVVKVASKSGRKRPSTLRKAVNRERLDAANGNADERPETIHPSMLGAPSPRVGLRAAVDVGRFSPVWAGTWSLEPSHKRPLKPKITLGTYVRASTSPTLDAATASALRTLAAFQRKSRKTQPSKPRRYVSGLREVAKGVRLRKIKLVVVATDAWDATPTLEAKLGEIVDDAQRTTSLVDGDPVPRIPVAYACGQKQLNDALGHRRAGKISAVGVLNADGVHEVVGVVSSLSPRLMRHWEFVRSLESSTTCCECGARRKVLLRCGLCALGPLCSSCAHVRRTTSCAADDVGGDLAGSILRLRAVLELRDDKDARAVRGRTHEFLSARFDDDDDDENAP